MYLPLAVSSFNKSKGKTSLLKICSIFRVLELKTQKIGRGAARKKKGGVARRYLYPQE
jgi:hypothetical protein